MTKNCGIMALISDVMILYKLLKIVNDEEIHFLHYNRYEGNRLKIALV
jgi:hypothetical protein